MSIPLSDFLVFRSFQVLFVIFGSNFKKKKSSADNTARGAYGMGLIPISVLASSAATGPDIFLGYFPVKPVKLAHQ